MAQIVPPPAEAVLKEFSLDENLTKLTPEEEAIASRDTVDGDGTIIEAPPTAEELEKLAEEVVRIDAAVEKLTERKEQIKVVMRRLDYGTQTIHADAGIKVTVGHNSRLNADRVKELYPFDKVVMEDKVVERPGAFGKTIKEVVPTPTTPNARLYKITPDPTAIKKYLEEDDVKKLYDEGEKRITIK